MLQNSFQNQFSVLYPALAFFNNRDWVARKARQIWLVANLPDIWQESQIQRCKKTSSAMQKNNNNGEDNNNNNGEGASKERE
jgi:hypothetical protein